MPGTQDQFDLKLDLFHNVTFEVKFFHLYYSVEDIFLQINKIYCEKLHLARKSFHMRLTGVSNQQLCNEMTTVSRHACRNDTELCFIVLRFTVPRDVHFLWSIHYKQKLQPCKIHVLLKRKMYTYHQYVQL